MRFERNLSVGEDERWIVIAYRVDECFEASFISASVMFGHGAVIRFDIDFGGTFAQIRVYDDLVAVA